MDKKVIKVYSIAIIVSLGGFVFGFDAAVISGVVGFTVAEFNLSDMQTGLVVASPTLGAVMASMTFGPLSDFIGRKKVLLIIAALYIVSAVFSAMAPSYFFLVSARFIGGLAFASLVLAPMYIAEIAPEKLRGKLISINQLNIVIGLSAAYFVNYLILQLSASGAEWVVSFGIKENIWRWMLAVEIFPAFVWFLLLLLIPESPRWLFMNNREEESKKIIKSTLIGRSVDDVVSEIRGSLKDKLPPLFSRLKELFTPKLKLALTIGIIVGIAQQITGINAIFFYAPSVFEQSGIGRDAAFVQAIFVGLINIIFTVLAMILIDKIGRRPLLISGLAGVFISMSVCAYGFDQSFYLLSEESIRQIEGNFNATELDVIVDKQFDNDIQFKDALKDILGENVVKANEASLLQAGTHMNPTIILIGILGFVSSFAFSLGPVMWVLFAEIFPNRLRGVAISFVGLINSAVSFMVQQLFPWELANFGTTLTFLIYGLFGLAGLILVYFSLPETKNKSLENIEMEFATKKIWSFR